MSYNIDNFTLKELDDLLIPLRAFYKSSRKDWHPETTRHKDGSIFLSGGEGDGITGTLNGSAENPILKVTDIDICGEGSGFFMNKILEPALKDSTGKLIASCIWEGGDSINKLSVENGKVTWENIEI